MDEIRLRPVGFVTTDRWNADQYCGRGRDHGGEAGWFVSANVAASLPGVAVAIALAAVGGAVIRRRRAPTVIAAIGPLLTLLACSASAPSTIHCEHVLAYAVAPSPQRSRDARNTSHDAPGRLRFAPPSCTAFG